MRHGKHVLCEKPLGMDAGEVERMLAVSRQEQVTAELARVGCKAKRKKNATELRPVEKPTKETNTTELIRAEKPTKRKIRPN